jgi:Amidohydrolase
MAIAGSHRGRRQEKKLMTAAVWHHRAAPPQLVRAANTVLRGKVVFGSDFPLLTPDRWLGDFAGLEIKPEVRQLILKENAVRLLGLDQATSWSHGVAARQRDRDKPIRVAACSQLPDVLEGSLRAGQIEVLLEQPRVMRRRLCLAAGIDKSRAAAAVSRADAEPASGLSGMPLQPGPDHQRPPGSRSAPHRDNLVEPQQPRQMHRIAGVGLDPIPTRTLQPR